MESQDCNCGNCQLIFSSPRCLVFSWQNTDLNIKVAIKVIKSQLESVATLKKYFKEEKQLITHPNLIEIYSITEVSNEMQNCMEMRICMEMLDETLTMIDF